MRTRERGMTNYGVQKERERELLTLARQKDNKVLLCEAAQKACPELMFYLVQSLESGRGYDRIFKKYYVPALKADFYTYRRKTLALFNILMDRNQYYPKGKTLYQVDAGELMRFQDTGGDMRGIELKAGKADRYFIQLASVWHIGESGVYEGIVRLGDLQKKTERYRHSEVRIRHGDIDTVFQQISDMAKAFPPRDDLAVFYMGEVE